MAETPDLITKVFDDFNGRRSGILKALTTDYIDFYEWCDPAKDVQCLVAFPNGTWEVRPPEMLIPSELPQPVPGINFIRPLMPEKEWAALVAAHCDSWLLAVAYYYGACAGFKKSEREMLFEKINELPTVWESVKESCRSNDQSGMTMLKKPASSSAVRLSSPLKDESGASIEDRHNDGSRSYGQSESPGTHGNRSSDDSRAQKDESDAALEDGYNGGSSSYGQSKSSGTYVNSFVDDSGAQNDGGAPILDGHNEESSSHGQSTSSSTHGNSSDDDSERENYHHGGKTIYALKVLHVSVKFKGRRSGVIKALTNDFGECDPGLSVSLHSCT